MASIEIQTSKHNQIDQADIDQPSQHKRLAYRLGFIGAHTLYEGHGKPVTLPPSYTYAKASRLTTNEMARLRDRAFSDDQRHHKVKGPNHYRRIAVGVRDAGGELVGFGDIKYRGNAGELGEFAVDPDHRGKGLGKAILDERLRLASEAGVDSLYIPFLESTNPLRSYYLERNFTETANGELVRGPNPVPIRDWTPVIEARNSGVTAPHLIRSLK